MFFLCATVSAQVESDPFMLPASSAWMPTPLITIGETVDGYTPPGITDGMGVREISPDVLRLYVGHELGESNGALYALQNGTQLKGARVSFFDIDKSSFQIVNAGIAYHTIIDRMGNEVTSGTQLNEGTDPNKGFTRFCSAGMHKAGTYGLEDDMFVTGEEGDNGLLYALDVNEGVFYCVPWAGRIARENVAFIDPGPHYPNRVAMLTGDDTEGAPMYLYLGDKNYYNDNSFLDRNGLAHGRMFVFASDDDADSPQEFYGTGNVMKGKFVELDYCQPDSAGTAHFDNMGFATQAHMHALALEAGAFRFSRPEDLHTNPENAYEFVMASTGKGNVFPQDDWGTLYTMKCHFKKFYNLRARLNILYDCNDGGLQFDHPDDGLRSPDNLCWASDGNIYVQEDRATVINAFGATSGHEASVWQINPNTGIAARVLEMNRNVVLPGGQTDSAPGVKGAWESSGIIDVSEYFPQIIDDTDPNGGSTHTFILNVQAHSVTNGSVSAQNLVQGGQILLLQGLMPWADQPDGEASVALLHLFPVPVHDKLNMCFSASEKDRLVIQVLDLSGRVVWSSDEVLYLGINWINLDLSTTTPGYYVLRTMCGNACSVTHILKQ
jgi:Bacterial protein of unknown function (DUF839)